MSTLALSKRASYAVAFPPVTGPFRRSSRQVQRGQPKQGQTPECGVMEVKPAGDDAWLTADSGQVSRYWERYRLVLVTNTRDFVLLGEDAHGRPAKLETFRLAGSLAEFESRLQRPRAFAREVGATLGEYLGGAISHRAALTEPQDLAWLLDRLTHHVHILEMNGDSYRLRHSRQSAASQVSD